MRSWGIACARVVLGLLMGMRGWDKVFTMTPAVHAAKFFTGAYANSWIPQWLLWIMGVTIPFVELGTGVLLVIGWRTNEALVGLGLLLMVVTYGHMLANPMFNDQKTVRINPEFQFSGRTFHRPQNSIAAMARLP